MILKTGLFKDGIDFLSTMKGSKFYEGAISFYVKEGNLYGRSINKIDTLSVSALLGTEVSEDFKAVVPCKQLLEIVGKYAGEIYKYLVLDLFMVI